MLHGGAVYSETFTRYRLPFTYPPFALLALTPVTFGSLAVAKDIWFLLIGLSSFGIVRAGLRCVQVPTALGGAPMALLISAICTIAIEPIRSNLDYGQVNLFLILCVVLDTLVLNSRHKGYLTGLAAAIKLTPIIYVVFFLIQGNRRAAVRATATFVTAQTIAWVFLPRDSITYWFHDAFSPSRTGNASSRLNQSLYATFHRFPFTDPKIQLSLWLAAVLVTVLHGVAVGRKLWAMDRPLEALLAVAFIEVLVSPISWSHHWSWVLLLPVVLIHRWGRWDLLQAAIGSVLLVALLAPYGWNVHGWSTAILNNSLPLASILLMIAWWRSARADVPQPSVAAPHGA
jgi:alpha-1,2-mannosyltransferase